MKDTPITNDYILKINTAIDDMEGYTNDLDLSSLCPYPDGFTEELQNHINILVGINISKIKEEYIDTLENYNKLFFQKKLFEFKFEKLLNWKYNYECGENSNNILYNIEFNTFQEFQVLHDINVKSLEFRLLRITYVSLASLITKLKWQIETLFTNYERLGQIYLESQNLMSDAKNAQAETKFQQENKLTIRIASKKKTDFIKLISAMYDCKIFVDENNKPLSNKQNLMDTFGEFLGEDFSAYSTSLSQAKNKGMDVFMKPLKDLEQAFKDYLNFTVNK